MPLINGFVDVAGPVRSLTSGWAPSGAVAQTMARDRPTGASTALVSGTLYVRAVEIPAGKTITNLNIISVGAETGGTHCWMCLLDWGRVVRAVSTDNTGATFLAGGNATITQALTSGGTYVTAADGIYYAGICAAFTGTAPTILAKALGGNISAVAPAFWGSSSTGQTTPPALGTAMAAITGADGFNFYAWVT